MSHVKILVIDDAIVSEKWELFDEIDYVSRLLIAFFQ